MPGLSKFIISLNRLSHPALGKSLRACHAAICLLIPGLDTVVMLKKGINPENGLAGVIEEDDFLPLKLRRLNVI